MIPRPGGVFLQTFLNLKILTLSISRLVEPGISPMLKSLSNGFVVFRSKNVSICPVVKLQRRNQKVFVEMEECSHWCPTQYIDRPSYCTLQIPACGRNRRRPSPPLLPIARGLQQIAGLYLLFYLQLEACIRPTAYICLNTINVIMNRKHS